jgi:hypothetical protein
MSTNVLFFFSLAVFFVPENLKKFENYHLERCQQLEKNDELHQAIARLTSENQSTREWLDTRIEEGIARATSDLRELFDTKIEEQSQIITLLKSENRSIGERVQLLEGLNTQRTFPDFPSDDRALGYSANFPEFPSDERETAPNVLELPSDERWNKRPAVSLSESKKRRKI